MTNYDIAEYFSLLSRLTDLHGADAFKAKTYSIAAYNIEKLPEELEQMDDAAIRNTKGIGDSTGRKIREILDTGKLTALEELLAQTPAGVMEILTVKGLGPKKVRTIWKEMGIESIGELEYACNENRLAAFKGFGAKTQEAVLQQIAFLRSNKGLYLWAEIEQTAREWISRLERSFPAYRFFLAGDLRRQLEIVTRIDIVCDMPPGMLLQYWKNVPSLVIHEAQEGRVAELQLPDGPVVRFEFAAANELFTTLFRHSCSASFLQAFLDQYGFPEHAASEADIFSSNGLAYIPPAQRETADILKMVVSGPLPDLVQPADIRALIHAHSRWSDGQETIETMARHAIAKGWTHMVISDHSQSAYYANGLSPERIAAQHQEIDALNERLAPFRIFKSIEADILNDGSLDYDDRVLATFDLVIASVHSNLKMTEEKAMQRLLKAIENPYTTILGHMTGRLLLSREGYPIDHRRIIDACAANQVVIEINAHPRRLDMDWRWISYALEQGVLLSVNPDAHALEGFDDVRYGCLVAQKGGLSADRNLSSFSLEAMTQFLATRKQQKML